MWIDRVVTELEDGPDILELHPRLTVMCSTDKARRKVPFQRAFNGMRGERGSHLEVRTDLNDCIVALRPLDGGDMQLIDADAEEPVPPDEIPRLGIIGQLNSAGPMAGHLRLLSVTPEALLERALTDAGLIGLAQTPIERLWSIAQAIQADRETVLHTEAQGTDLSETVRERESIEEVFSDILDEREESLRKNRIFYVATAVCLAGALAVLITSNPLYAIPLIVVAVALGVAGARSARNHDLERKHAELAEQFGGTGFGVQLGRLDELFNTNTIYRRQREARDNLDRSLGLWRELAGDISPDVLIRERPRIEELAGHIRVINNEQVTEATQADRDMVLGFASLLAELTRRFPTERVPLFIEDLFSTVHPEYHPALRELVNRAALRRQVILETADIETGRWVATEAVAGNALLITDEDIDVTPARAHEQREAS